MNKEKINGKSIRKVAFYLGIFAVCMSAGIFFDKYTSNKIQVETIAVNSDVNALIEESDELIDGKININTASSELLQTIDGIGEATAKKIIDYRNENGGFASAENIMDVPGIGEKKYSAISDKICAE